MSRETTEMTPEHPLTYRQWATIKSIGEQCEAGVRSFSNDQMSGLLVLVDKLRTFVGVDSEGIPLRPRSAPPSPSGEGRACAELPGGGIAKQGNITWSSGCLYRIQRVEPSLIADYWHEPARQWIGSGNYLSIDERLATAAEIAATSIPLADIPEPIRAAVAALRSTAGAGETFVPTPHEPVEGVTLRQMDYSYSMPRMIDVDGEFAHWSIGICGNNRFEKSDYEASEPNTRPAYCVGTKLLASIRDRIRSERAAAGSSQVTLDDSTCKEGLQVTPARVSREEGAAPAGQSAVAEAYVPWTFETMPVAVKVRHRDRGEVALARPLDDGCVEISNAVEPYSNFFYQYEQLDGTPCGAPARRRRAR